MRSPETTRQWGKQSRALVGKASTGWYRYGIGEQCEFAGRKRHVVEPQRCRRRHWPRPDVLQVTRLCAAGVRCEGAWPSYDDEERSNFRETTRRSGGVYSTLKSRVSTYLTSRVKAQRPVWDHKAGSESSYLVEACQISFLRVSPYCFSSPPSHCITRTQDGSLWLL